METQQRNNTPDRLRPVDLFSDFIDFEAFDRIWHARLWQVFRSFNIEKGLVQTITVQYENTSCAVLLKNQPGEFFKTTVGVCQGCLLSPILFNLFLEKIMQKTLNAQHTSISIGWRPLCKLRFADDINLMGRSIGELQDLTSRLLDRAIAYETQVSTDHDQQHEQHQCRY